MECIKPLRNYLRRFNTVSFLQSIWFLSNHLEFRQPLPPYLAGANPQGIRSSLGLGFFLWELDTLAREVVLHCDPQVGKKVTEWKQVAVALNKLKKAENDAYAGSEINVFSEITRIAHRQFHWQQGISHNDLIRTRKIYRSAGMNEVVRHVYSLSAEEVALAGFAALATHLEHFAMTSEWSENVSKFLGFNPRPLIQNLTTDLRAIKQSARDVRSLNENWAYAFNPLWLHPLIQVGDGRVICPMPGLLARRATEGLYFDIAGHSGDALSEYMGPAFQAFIGEVLERANDGNFEIQGEQAYGTTREPRDTVDWLVTDQTASLFVEVKVLKLGKAVKECLAPDATVTAQLRKLAKAIGQVYATLAEALAGRYPNWKPNGKPVHPLIVTLDNWNLFSHDAQGVLGGLVEEEFLRRKLDLKLIQEHQYVVCCANELETAIQVMHAAGIQPVMQELTTGQKVGWLLSSHLRADFPTELASVKPLFPEERRSFLPRPCDTEMR